MEKELEKQFMQEASDLDKKSKQDMEILKQKIARAKLELKEKYKALALAGNYAKNMGSVDPVRPEIRCSTCCWRIENECRRSSPRISSNGSACWPKISRPNDVCKFHELDRANEKKMEEYENFQREKIFNPDGKTSEEQMKGFFSNLIKARDTNIESDK